MIKKIVISVVLIISLVSNGYSEVSVTVSRAGHTLIKNGSNIYNIPRIALAKAKNIGALTVGTAAEVVGTSAGGKVLRRSIPILAGRSLLSLGIAGLVIAGISYVGGKLIDDLLEDAAAQGGTLEGGRLVAPVGPTNMASLLPEITTRYDKGHFTTPQAASAAITNWRSIMNLSCAPANPNLTCWAPAAIQHVSHNGMGTYYLVVDFMQPTWCPSGANCDMLGYATYSESVTRGDTVLPLTVDQIEDLVDSIADTNPEAYINAGADALDTVAAAVNNPSHPLRMDPNVDWEELAKALWNSLNPTAITNMNNSLTDPVTYPADDIADVTDPDYALNENNPITQAEIQNAAKAALTSALAEANTAANAETLSPLDALPITEEPEEMGTISTLIDDFMDSLSSLPVLSFFNDIKDISASGSCTLDIDLVNPITSTTQNINLSFCPYESTFNFMGSIFLLITGIMWIRYLFEG